MKKATAIFDILSYVPDAKPMSPIKSINIFFDTLKTVSVLLREQITNSIIGGNKRASAVLLTAPTSVMKRPSLGMSSASMTVS